MNVSSRRDGGNSGSLISQPVPVPGMRFPRGETRNWERLTRSQLEDAIRSALLRHERYRKLDPISLEDAVEARVREGIRTGNIRQQLREVRSRNS